MLHPTQCDREGFWSISCSFKVWFREPLCWRFHWFEKSTKRKFILKEYYDFCDVDYQEVIKYISTHWLCTETCVNWELKKYPGLRSYFQSENELDQRFVRLHETFSDPMMEVYMYFYRSALPTFATLDLATSLNAIMLIKMNQSEHLLSCHSWKIPNELLKRCKSACWEYNQEHSSKWPCK